MQKMNPRVKSVLKTAGDFLSTFITTNVAIVAIALIIVKLLGWNMFSIDSPSMAPKYPVDSLVVVEKVEPEKIQAGDVITFVLNEKGTLATHRVVSVNSGSQTFTTKGDANNTEDASPVQWGNTVGRVKFGIPFLGKPMRVLTAEQNRPYVIAAIILLFISSVVWDIVSRKGRKKHQSAHAKKVQSEMPPEE